VIHLQGSSLLANTHTVTVSCTVAANLGTYTIPPAALSYLPPVAPRGRRHGRATLGASEFLAAGTGSGASFTGTALTHGLMGGGQVDYGSFAPLLTASKSIAIQ